MSSSMNRAQKMKVAKDLFKNTSMTKEQYHEFCLLAEELDSFGLLYRKNTEILNLAVRKTDYECSASDFD